MLSSLLLMLATGPAALPEPVEPVEPGPGWFKPAEVEKGCVARAVAVPPGMGGEGRVPVRFAVEVDGTADRVELPWEVPGPLAEAIDVAVRGCRFTPGRWPDGRPAAVWITLPLRFVEEQAGAPAGAPAIPGTPPREATPGCIANDLHYRFPPNRLLRGLVAVRVGVSPEGRLGAFQFPPGLEEDVVSALRLSIQACAILPARTAEGRPVAGVLEYRIHFGPPAGGQDGPKLQREARLASTTCLQRLRPSGVIGHAVVQVRVTTDGEPTDFRVEPQNLPVDLRLQIIDVLTLCKWEPALGLDGQPVDADTSVTIRYP